MSIKITSNRHASTGRYKSNHASSTQNIKKQDLLDMQRNISLTNVYGNTFVSSQRK